MASPQYNLRSSAVKRLMREAEELRDPTKLFFAQPLDDNLFEWHFTVRGPKDSEFENGLYHGRIILPSDYPMKPPNIILLTPNGRFETNKKICLSISGYHPESWQPSWSIRTALLAIIGFMPSHGGGSIGSLDYSPEERKKLAFKSKDWLCPICGTIKNKLIEEDINSTPDSMHEEAKNLADQISFKGENEKIQTSTPDNSPTEIPASPESGRIAGSEDSQIQSPSSPNETLLERGGALLSSLPSTSPSREMLARRLDMLKRQKDRDTGPLTPKDDLNGEVDRTVNLTTTNASPKPAGSKDRNSSHATSTLPRNTDILANAQANATDPACWFTWSTFFIVTIALALLLLIGRRLYLANAWRFYPDDASGGGPSRDEF